MNTRRSLIDEMAAQPKPKKAKTQPNGRRAVTRYLKRMWKGAISGRPIRPAGPAAETAARQMEEREVAPFWIYGRSQPPCDISISGWWQPLDKWQKKWTCFKAGEYRTARPIRVRPSLDPERLP